MNMMLAPSYIDFSNMSRIMLETVLNSIIECLKIAGKHGGRTFGGFVRDVIVPRLFKPNCYFKFKDVDIWFQTQKSADAFVKDMGSSFIEESIFASDPANLDYEFTRKQYHLYQHDTCIAWFDIIVSKTIPVNDFNVNKLTYLYKEDSSTPIPESFGDESTTTLINAIHNKHVIILPEYVNILMGRDRRGRGYCIKSMFRLNRIFFNKGWNVSCLTKVPSDPSINWFRMNITSTPVYESHSVPNSNNLPTPALASASTQHSKEESLTILSNINDSANSILPVSISTSKQTNNSINQTQPAPISTSKLTNNSINQTQPASVSTSKQTNNSKEEAMAAFNMGLEAMKLAFLKVVDK
jgi:hypothetical protein